MKKAIITIIFFGLITQLSAQELPQEPLTFNADIAAKFDLSGNTALDFTPPQEDLTLAETYASDLSIEKGDGFVYIKDIDFKTNAQQTVLDNGDKLWVLVIKAEKAKGAKIVFGSINIPEGGHLFAYNPERTSIDIYLINEYRTSTNKLVSRKLKGETIILEYYEPQNVNSNNNFKIIRHVYIYNEDLFYQQESLLKSENNTETS